MIQILMTILTKNTDDNNDDTNIDDNNDNKDLK